MSTLKADTLQAKTTNGTLTLSNNGTGKVELPADATIGGVALGSDQVARDMAASALALILANTDANQNGAVGPFWLADDFESDNLTTKTNATYSASGDYYHNPGGGAISGATGTNQGDGSGTLANAFDGNESQPRASAYNSSGNNAAVNVGKFYSGGQDITGYRAVGRSDHGFIETSTGSFSLKLYGSDVGFKHAGATLLDTHSFTDTQDAIEVDRSNIGTWNYDYYWVEIPASGSGAQDSGIAELVFYNIADPTNVTLAPTAVTLTTANPTDILAYVVIDPQEAITVGTDIVMTASIDGGTTDATVSWTKVGDIGTTELYRVEFDVSAQTGSSLTYEITTANNKEIRYNASVGLVPLY